MEWRSFLYPLGFLASFAFGSRFIVQWLQSEIKGRSVVTPLFWQLSLLGNALLLVHAFIQVQYPLCLAQGVNLVISWRNLDLMQLDPAPLRRVLWGLAFIVTVITAAFAIQGVLLIGELDWVRTPTQPWATGPGVKFSLWWHVFGATGIFLFSSRFWVQWWQTERCGYSVLTPSFWWMSLVGALLALTYFLRLQDTVNVLGMSFGIIPYVRNLALSRSHA